MRRNYLSCLERAARWYLPPAEAAEVLEDYRDLIEQAPRSEEELCRDLGTPKAAVGQLVQLKAYHRWLAVFVVLAACVVLPAADVVLDETAQIVFNLHVIRKWTDILGLMNLWMDLFLGGIADKSLYAEILFPVGVALSLAWFQRSGRREQALPKKIPPLLLLLLAGMAWVWFIAWIVLGMRFDLLNALFPTEESGRVLRATLALVSLTAGAAGTLGLVKARLGDRRWRAVYILGMTVAVLAVFLWKLVSSMALDFSSEGWQFPYYARAAFITAVGLVGTAVSLC